MMEDEPLASEDFALVVEFFILLAKWRDELARESSE